MFLGKKLQHVEVNFLGFKSKIAANFPYKLFKNYVFLDTKLQIVQFGGFWGVEKFISYFNLMIRSIYDFQIQDGRQFSS